jgi:serine/threonine protein kinase
LVSGLNETNPPSQSAYWPAITRIEKEFPSSEQPAPHGHADTPAEGSRSLSDTDQAPGITRDPSVRPADLDFLEPSDDPAYIGRLHHFQVARVLGRGGMGIVLEAFDTHLHRNVAIKVLNPQFQQNDIARQRFCREGRAAAAISHEHVVAMYQVARAQAGEVAYLVMQLIEGVTLESLLSDARPLPVKDVARIGMQIAAGLSAAHARDMVHRDIKPANILIEAETERVKLTDFGLARATDDIKLTKTGMVTGTPLYMSPEQTLGGTADERSDLFSLGAVMYEMATGSSPFQAPSALGVMKRITDETPIAPHRVNAAISRPLSDLIMALMEKNPEDRPDSAAAVATALASIVMEHGPISPLQVPAVAASEVKKASGQHRTLQRRVIGAWIAAVFALICLLGSVAIWSRMSATNEGSAGTDTTFPSVVLPGNSGTVWSVDFSPSGNEVAAAIEDGSVRLWDIESQEIVKSFNAHRGIVWMVKFHPTRPLVATSGDDSHVKLWDAESFEMVKQWRVGSAVRQIAFSPDGDRIVAGDRDGVIHIYDIDSGEELASITQPGSILGVDYSADGKLIATVTSDKVVRVWDAESLSERQTLMGHDGPIYNVAFASQGPLLATVGWGKNIRVWNVETGAEVHNLIGSEGDVWGVSFCGDGTHLVTSGQEGAAHIWDLSNGSMVATLRGHESAVHNISLDTETRRIATSGRDGTVRIWDLSGLEPKK